MSTHDAISPFMLERYAVGELSGSELEAVEAALANDPALKARVESMQSAREQFLVDEPYAGFRIAHEQRVPAKKRFGFLMPTYFAAAAAAALLLIAVIPEVTDDGTRIKGAGVGLTVALVGVSTPKPLASGAVVHPGDRLQLAYDAGEHEYIALIGIDGSGATSVYYPESGEVMALRKEQRGAFPFSLTLDATPGNETLVAVFAEEPLPTRRIEDAVRKKEVLPGVSTVKVVLAKEP